MPVVYKYPLVLTATQHITLPKDAEILSVQQQAGQLVLWAIIEQNNTMVKRQINIIGTGNPFEGCLGTFIGTLQAAIFVWHIFDGGEVS